MRASAALPIEWAYGVPDEACALHHAFVLGDISSSCPIACSTKSCTYWVWGTAVHSCLGHRGHQPTDPNIGSLLVPSEAFRVSCLIATRQACSLLYSSWPTIVNSDTSARESTRGKPVATVAICGNLWQSVEICGNRVEICGNRGNLWQSCGNRNKLTTYMYQTYVANSPIKNDQRIQRTHGAQWNYFTSVTLYR